MQPTKKDDEQLQKPSDDDAKKSPQQPLPQNLPNQEAMRLTELRNKKRKEAKLRKRKQ